MGSSLVLLRLAETKLERTLGLSWREDRYPSRAEHHFRRFTVDYFSRLSWEDDSDPNRHTLDPRHTR